MKNLITITALIAAGAIGANAELKPGDNFGGLAWNQLTLTNPTSTLSSSNSGFNWSGVPQSNLTNSWSLLFTLNTQTDAADNNDVFGTNGATSHGTGGYVLGLTENLSKIGLYTDKSSVSGKFTGLCVNFTNGQNVMLTFLKYDNATATSRSKAGKFVLTTYAANSTTLAATASIEVDSLKLNDLTFNKNGNSRLWTNSGKETFSNIKLAYGSAIPEPSAFGLLAGLGALALVGARRRRRK